MKLKNGQILIDIDDFASTVSLIEDGKLGEFYIEYDDINLLTGNIYKGRVVNVLQGLQTAFVDIGLEKNGFLYVGEMLDDRSDLRKSGAIPSMLNIKEGDYVMVQVTKEETATKGARLTMNISLPGRFVVYTPTIDFVGVSNKIIDPKLREKLTDTLTKLKDKSEGFIARTRCQDCEKSDILNEAKALKLQFGTIKDSFLRAEGISLIHSEGNLLFRTVRDMLQGGVNSIVCNDKGTVERLKEVLSKQKSHLLERLTFYNSDIDIFEQYGISDELDKLLERKIILPSLGSLVIDKTEALTSIDVNTGRFKGASDHEETVFLTNIEAAKEIARQVRLRNIGGLIVIDFIDMLVEKHKEEVVETLRREFSVDRIKTRVMDMSGLGLVEVTRKKVGYDISSFVSGNCPHCGGTGITHSPLFMSRKIKIALKRLFKYENYASAMIHINSAHCDQIVSSRFFSKECSTIWANKRIYVVPTDNIKMSGFTLSGTNQASLTLPTGSKLLY